MDDPAGRLESAIAAIEAQRPLLGDDVVASAVEPLRRQLETLRAAARPTQSLRPTTILFMDIVGSTRLSGSLDPEDVHDVVDRALDRITSIVATWGGRVLQYAGDSLLAVFGAEQAREDDAVRAVHAGLAILTEAPALADDVARRFGLTGFNVRVGVHSGPVLLGGGVDGDASIRGLAVNIAARMEQTAPAGSLRISQDTYRQVRGMFDVAAQPPLAVKGVDQPMRSFLVLRAKPRAFRLASRGVEGVEAHLVGRAVELAALTDAYRTARDERRLVQITVVGEPGIGKTRLALEFTDWIEALPEEVLLFRARSDPRGESVPFGLVRDLIAWRLEILDGDPQGTAKAKLATGLAAVLGERAAEFTALIGRLIGLDFDHDRHIAGIADEARQLRDRGFHAIVQYLRALQRQGDAPLVLLLDDLHWADDGSLDFVRYLVGDCADVPMLVVGMTRPALFERRPLGVAGAEPHLRIDLAPLPLDGSRELVGALLARLDTVPAALRDMLTTSAEGNAYFLEELIGMLIDDGVIVTSGERWRLVPDRLLSIKLPGTLAGVLQARLDVLPASERAALQAASVVGHVFWDEVVREIVAGARAGGDTDATLDALAGRDLSHRREPSAFPNSREFAFRHHLVHQVTYQGLLKRTRQVHHRQVADWLVRRSGDRRDEYLAAIAEHYERAGDAANAVAYLRRAGESAARAYANEAALDLFGRALALLPADDAQARIEIIRGRLTVHKVLARRDAHEADVATCERLAETLDDDYSRADAASNRASLMLLLGDYPGVVVAASRAIALADKIGPRAAGLAASCQIHLGRALQAQGDFGSAARHIERSLALASQLGNRTTECIALIQLGIIAMSHGDYGAARLRYHEALENARERGDRVREAAALNNLGDIDQMLGDYRAAQAAFEQCRPIAAEVGAPQLVATLLANLASVAFRRGDAAAAIGFAEQSIASARQNKDVNLVAQACCIHGQALAALGQGAKAATAYEESVAIYRRIGRPTQLPEPLCGLARLALARGTVTEAVALVSEVVAHFDAGGTVDGTEDPAWVHLTCHDVLRANDDSRADEFLARGHAELMTRAAKLAPAERARFLGDVPSHRNLLAACIARGWSEQATWDVAADAAARLSPSL